MNELRTVTINTKNITVKEYQGKRVVTLKDIDSCHERPEGTARRNFNQNKQHLIEGIDYFKVCADEIRTRKIMDISSKTREDVTLITESGYLMLVKSFTDDLAWDVQRQLVNTYFRYMAEQPKTENPYEYFDKTYNGEPVLTLEDVECLTGMNASTVNAYLKKSGVELWDYYLLTRNSLKAFKTENPKVNKMASKILIITKDGFAVICKAYKLKIAQPKCFAPKQESETLTQNIMTIKDRLTAMNVLLDRLADFDGDTETAKKLKREYAASFYRTLSYLSAETGVTIDHLGKYFKS